ncbi:AaceriAER353Wp [[Ashbya] aceris (nom. inval.)]|nr:AaceriAER353Wp [[Ashbya] aceris (nom. inval.)]
MKDSKRNLKSCNVPGRATRRFESPFVGSRRRDEGRVSKRTNTTVRQRGLTRLRLEQRLQTMQEPEVAVQWAQSFVRRSRALLGRLREEDVELQRQLSEEGRRRAEQAAHVERILVGDLGTGRGYNVDRTPKQEEIAIGSDGSEDSMALEFELDESEEHLSDLEAHTEADGGADFANEISSYSSEPSGYGTIGSSDDEHEDALREEYAVKKRGDEALQLLALQAIDRMSTATAGGSQPQEDIVGSLALPENIDSMSELEYDAESASQSEELLLDSPESVEKMGSSGMNTPTSVGTATPEASNEEILEVNLPEQAYRHPVHESETNPSSEFEEMDETAEQDEIHSADDMETADDVIETSADPCNNKLTENKSPDRDYGISVAGAEISASPMSSDGTFFSYREDTVPAKETARSGVQTPEPRTYRLIYTGSAYSENSQDAEPPRTDLAEYSSAFAENPFKEENQQTWDREALHAFVKQLNMKHSDHSEGSALPNLIQLSKEQVSDSNVDRVSSSVHQVTTIQETAPPAASSLDQAPAGPGGAMIPGQMSVAHVTERSTTNSTLPDSMMTQKVLPRKIFIENDVVIEEPVTDDSLSGNGLMVEPVSDEPLYNVSPEVLHDSEVLVEPATDELERHKEVKQTVEDKILVGSSEGVPVISHCEESSNSPEILESIQVRIERDELSRDELMDNVSEEIGTEPPVLLKEALGQAVLGDEPRAHSIPSSINVEQEFNQPNDEMEYDTKGTAESDGQSSNREANSSQDDNLPNDVIPLTEHATGMRNPSPGDGRSPYFESNRKETPITSTVAPLKEESMDEDDAGKRREQTGTSPHGNPEAEEQIGDLLNDPKPEEPCGGRSSSSEVPLNTDEAPQNTNSSTYEVTMESDEERQTPAEYSVQGTSESGSNAVSLATPDQQDIAMEPVSKPETPVQEVALKEEVAEPNVTARVEEVPLDKSANPADAPIIIDDSEPSAEEPQTYEGTAASSADKYSKLQLKSEDDSEEISHSLIQKPIADIVFEKPAPFTESSAKTILQLIKQRETYSPTASRAVKSNIFGEEHLSDLENVVFEHPSEDDPGAPSNSALADNPLDASAATSSGGHEETISYEAEPLDIPLVGTLSSLNSMSDVPKADEQSEMQENIPGEEKDLLPGSPANKSAEDSIGSAENPMSSVEDSVGSVEDQEVIESVEDPVRSGDVSVASEDEELVESLEDFIGSAEDQEVVGSVEDSVNLDEVPVGSEEEEVGSAKDSVGLVQDREVAGSVQDREVAEVDVISSDDSASADAGSVSSSEIPVDVAVDRHSPSEDKAKSVRPLSAGRLIGYSVNSIGSFFGRLKEATSTAKEQLLNQTGNHEHKDRKAVYQLEHTCPGRWLPHTDGNNESGMDSSNTHAEVDSITILENSPTQQEPIVIDSDECEGELEVQSVPTTPIRSSQNSNRDGIIARIRDSLRLRYPARNHSFVAQRSPVYERICDDDNKDSLTDASSTEKAALSVAFDIESSNLQATSPRGASKHFGSRTEDTRDITTKSLMVNEASATTVRSSKEKKRSVRRRKRPITDDSAIHVGKRKKVHTDDSAAPHPAQEKNKRRPATLQGQKKHKRRLRPRTK